MSLTLPALYENFGDRVDEPVIPRRSSRARIHDLIRPTTNFACFRVAVIHTMAAHELMIGSIGSGDNFGRRTTDDEKKEGQ